MDYFPVFLDLDGKSCLLVGAGEVAARKARLLLSAGANLTVVAPQVGADLVRIAAQDPVTIIRRRFQPPDVDGHWLAICATNDASVQRAVKRAADRATVFCNGVDDLENSSYITPAIVDRSPVVVAISSGGAAPVLARRIRAQFRRSHKVCLSARARSQHARRGCC